MVMTSQSAMRLVNQFSPNNSETTCTKANFKLNTESAKSIENVFYGKNSK